MAEYAREDFPIIARNEDYVMRRVMLSADWMEGSIEGEDFGDNDAARMLLATAVLNSFTEIKPEHRNSSTCTDGRWREGLLDGSDSVPVSAQLVGATAISGFVVAEALGEKFYGDRVNDPVSNRFWYSLDAMRSNGEDVKTHMGCGAAAGLVAVNANIVRFGADVNYRRRLRIIMPDGVFDERMHEAELAATQARLERNMYDGYSAELVTADVSMAGGDDKVELYNTEGPKNHGHNEAAVVIEDESIEGVAINPNSLIRATHKQVFGVNNSKADALALMFSNGGDNEEAYLQAWHAMANFSSAGHGTLGKGLETWLASKA